MAGKHSKKSDKNILSFFILLICISLLVYSVLQILKWLKDTNKIKNEMKQINDVVSINTPSDETNIEIIPFAITGTYKLFYRDLKIVYGKPIKVKSENLEKENEKLRNRVVRMIGD